MGKLKTFREIGKGYTDEEKKVAFESLNIVHQKIFEKAYGKDLSEDKRKLTKEEQKQFNIASTMFKKKLNYLRKNANEKPKTLNDYYLDYAEEEIRQALPTLKDTHQAIIIKVYGKELKENNFDILNNEEKILLHSAKFALNSKLKRLRAKTDPLFKTLNDYFPDYLITEIKRVLTLLDSKHVKIIEKAYGKDLEKVNFSKLTSEQRRQLLLARYALKNKLKQTENELKLGQKKLIDYFSDYTYKEIQRGVSNLPEKYQSIIRQVFGENLRKTCGSKLSKESQTLLLKAIKELDKKYLIKDKKTKLKDFFEYFEEETLDEIKFAFSAVAIDYQDILVKAYGEDFNENNTCYLSSKERHFLAAARTEIRRKLKSLQTKKSPKFKILFDYYQGYSEEEILRAFSRLDVSYKNIIEKAYGKNLNEIKNKNLTDEENGLLKIAKDKLLKQLQTPHCLENDICNFLKVSEINNDFLATLENSTLKDLEYIFEYILVKKTNLTEEERKYYSAVLLKLKFLYATKDDLEIEENSDWESISKHLDKEKCHSYIMTLNPTTQVIINAKLGFLDDKKIYSYKTIAEVTQIPVEDIHQIVMNTLWDIRNFIAENNYVKKPTKK